MSTCRWARDWAPPSSKVQKGARQLVSLGKEWPKEEPLQTDPTSGALGARPRRSFLLGTFFALASLFWAGPAKASSFQPELSTLGNYSETFTFIGDLDDGSYVHISLVLTNLGPGSLKGLCRAIVASKGARTVKAGQHVDRDDFRWSGNRDGNEVLRIGACSAWIEGEETGVEVSVDRVKLKLVFAGRPLRRSLLHDASVLVGQSLYRSEVLLLRTPVEATIGLAGAPPRNVSGAGYVDHSWSTVPPKDLASRWVRFRALRGSRALVILARESVDGRFSPAWACEGPDRCQEFTGFQVEKHGEGDAATFTTSLLDAGKPAIVIRSDRLLFHDAALDDLGFLGKILTPIVGASVTYVSRAEASSGEGDPVEGILEVEVHQ